jgi:hypothetical protein
VGLAMVAIKERNSYLLVAISSPQQYKSLGSPSKLLFTGMTPNLFREVLIF